MAGHPASRVLSEHSRPLEAGTSAMDSTSGELLPSQQENVSVVLRVRPLNDMELKRGDKKVLSCVDKRTVRILDLHIHTSRSEAYASLVFSPHALYCRCPRPRLRAIAGSSPECGWSALDDTAGHRWSRRRFASTEVPWMTLGGLLLIRKRPSPSTPSQTRIRRKFAPARRGHTPMWPEAAPSFPSSWSLAP